MFVRKGRKVTFTCGRAATASRLRRSPGSIWRCRRGDTILSIAGRLRPVLVDQPVERLATPQRRHALDRWPQKPADARVRRIDARQAPVPALGQRAHDPFPSAHVGALADLERDFDQGRLSRGSWLVIETARHSIVQFQGPILELIREPDDLRPLPAPPRAGRARLGPILVRLRSDDPTRPVADALLDQRTLAGIGNLWKNESLDECRIDPSRRLSDVSDEDLERVVRKARELMLRETRRGGRLSGGEVFEQRGKRCRRCGDRIRVRGQWDENRMTYWCPTCQA
jgi:endonuclease-8